MKRGTPDHPKVFDLCDALKIRRPAALGHLELLWHFTAKYAPQGDVGRYPDKRIEAALDWAGAPGRLVLALTSTGWLDDSPSHRLLVHDWRDHADQAVVKRLLRSHLSMHTVTKEVTGHCPENGGQSLDNVDTKLDSRLDNGSLPEPVPEPEPVPDVGGEQQGVLSSLKNNLPDIDTPPFDTLEDVVKQIHERHPNHPYNPKCGPGEVRAKLTTIISKLPKAKREQKLLEINKTHAEWCATELWKKEGGQYAKGLANWLAPTMLRYESPAPLPAVATSKLTGMYAPVKLEW